MSDAVCTHDEVQTFREADGGPRRMWACRACHRRMYPACSICGVGHRSGHPEVAAGEETPMSSKGPNPPGVTFEACDLR